MPSLTVVSGPDPEKYYPLGKAPMIIGRDEGVPIQIRDEMVSRKHVKISRDGASGKYLAFDMKSANGTIINGRQIESETPLEDGDVIEVGGSKIIYSDRDFEDRESALQHHKQVGERGKSTLIR